MRLLNVNSLEFAVFHSDIPKYAIASHRWSLGSEATFKDFLKERNTSTIGYRKVQGFAKYVQKEVPGVHWLWIDTCCIIQESSEEVSEAVNSMFRLYRGAEICIAYLADVTTPEDLGSFQQSQWFTRGWTLQELLAPTTVVFVTSKWQVIGHKGSKTHPEAIVGPSLENMISTVTGISEDVLDNYDYSKALSAEQKLEWMADRETTREEDESYCLLGMFDVFMPIIYGEGRDRARKRLVTEIANLRTVPIQLEADYVVLEKAPRSLHDAASSGNLEFITQLLDTTPSTMDQLWKWDSGGSLPLHRAVQNGHALTCKLLMASMNKQTWDPSDLLDTKGKSPIMYALSTDYAYDDVVREFLTDEGLCFSVPAIFTMRKSVLARLLDIGGFEALQRAVTVMRRVLPSEKYCDIMKRALPMIVTLPESDPLVVHVAVQSAKLDMAKSQELSGSLAKMTDIIYDWTTSERVRRLVLLHKAEVLDSLVGSDGINFVGKAIVARDLTTLNALHAIDSQMLSQPVGWWTKHHLAIRPPMGKWHPLRFAALIRDLETTREVAQLSDPEDNKPPHLRAVHIAALAAIDSQAHKNTWLFLRNHVPENHSQQDAQFCTVDLEVKFDSDWGCLVFPHSYEAVIEDLQTANIMDYMWDGGYVRRHEQKSASQVTFGIRVRMRTASSRDSVDPDDLVHVDFMHGWNDLRGAGEQGRVVITYGPQSNAQAKICFRESNQHQFKQLQDDLTLSSGTDWTESHHNLRSWQLRCVRI